MRQVIFCVLLATAGFLTSGCTDTAQRVDGKCQANDDCPEYNFCDPAGVCRCNDDSACDATEFCNLAGSCQVKLACYTNEDCVTSENPTGRCDTRQPKDGVDGATDDAITSKTGGQCVTLSAQRQCLLDSHCPFGTFCANDVCLPGCRDNGDCPVGDPCISGQCDPSPGACNDISFCEYGQRCVANRCQTHPDADVLCQRCRGDDILDASCGFGSCLIDNSVPDNLCTDDSQCSTGYCVKFPCGSNADCPADETCQPTGFFGRACSGHCGDFFCGNASCDEQTDPCPKGYFCYQLIRISNQLCTRGGNECRQGAACSADAGRENTVTGSCSCLSNADCPGDLTCVNPGPSGACIEGSTCGPLDGLLCEDLR